MALSIVYIFKVVVVLEMVLITVKGFSLREKDNFLKVEDGSLSTRGNIPDNNAYQTTIRQYARHGLCRNFEGKRRLYNAMKKKFCDISLSMIQGHVMDLCRHKNHMLDKWVKELFDMDGNGYISHFEKHYYT